MASHTPARMHESVGTESVAPMTAEKTEGDIDAAACPMASQVANASSQASCGKPGENKQSISPLPYATIRNRLRMLLTIHCIGGNAGRLPFAHPLLEVSELQKGSQKPPRNCRLRPGAICARCRRCRPPAPSGVQEIRESGPDLPIRLGAGSEFEAREIAAKSLCRARRTVQDRQKWSKVSDDF